MLTPQLLSVALRRDPWRNYPWQDVLSLVIWLSIASRRSNMIPLSMYSRFPPFRAAKLSLHAHRLGGGARVPMLVGGALHLHTIFIQSSYKP